MHESVWSKGLMPHLPCPGGCRVEQSPVCLLTLALCKGGDGWTSVKWLFLCVLVLGFYFFSMLLILFFHT